jgi:hypothetical protein
VTQLNTPKFLALLRDLDRGIWAPRLEGSQIFLKLEGSEWVFSPLTAVYYHLTDKVLHRGSFWMEELTKEFGFPWWEVIDISYAINSSDRSNALRRNLRRDILRALDLPLDPQDL